MRRLAMLLGFPIYIAVACGPSLPPRAVLERNLGAYHFRRYQEVHDIEVPVASNPAVGHTASYVRGGDNVRVAPVFVTRYAHAQGIAEALKAALKGMDGYAFKIVRSHGAHVYDVRGELGDAWLIWVSGAQLVKLGVPQGEREVPEPLVAAYVEAYPSALDVTGHAER